MRIFRYWVSDTFSFEHRGEKFSGRCFGGSNQSPAEAMLDARTRWEAVRKRIIEGGAHGGEDYVADIREEVLCEFNANNVVTRNRYGAEVLNSTDHLFVDIDRAPWTWRNLFGGKRTIDEQRNRMIEHVKKIARTPVLASAGLRVYATPRGVRLLVVGLEHSARSRATRDLMSRLHADGLYMTLCRQQACYRARLTPKPSRVRIRTPKCTWPRDPTEDRSIREWIAQYEIAANQFAACHLVDTLGAFSSTPVSEYHDTRCRARENLPLA